MRTGDDDDDEATRVPPPPIVAAAPGPTPYLIVLQGLTAGQVVTLDQPACIIGRGEESDLLLPDRAVSSIHAVVHVGGDGVVSIEDLNSSNGTLVNDRRVRSSRPLQDGDKISVGSTTILKFTYDGALKDSLAAKLTAGARIDGLTGAHRERFFNEVLREDFAYTLRHKTLLSLALISVDHFHTIISTHGRAAGDEVLAEFGRRARRALPQEHLFGRLGARAFGVLYRAVDSEEACALTEQIRLALAAAPVLAGGRPLTLTMSAGVSTVPFRGIDTVEKFMRFADLALLDAKATHDCVVRHRA